MIIVRGDYVWTGKELLHDTAVLCKDGIIEKIASRNDLEAAHPEATVVGDRGTVVLPGLINAHHHGNGVTSFMQGIEDDSLETWLAALGSATPVDPYLDTLFAAIGLLRAGFTTVGIFQSSGVGEPEDIAEDARARIKACVDVGLRVAFGVTLMQQNFYVYGKAPQELPVPKTITSAQYITLLEQLTDEFASEPTVSIFAAPSGPQWVTSEAWETIGAWTREKDVPLHTHCLESPYEAEYARRAYGSAVTYMDKRGALHEKTSLVHGVYLKDEELDLMADRGASLITNPGSNLRLRCGVSPVLAALKRGATVGLGTDSCSLGERDDAFEEMRLLYYLQRGPGMNTPAITWEQCVEAATEGAASVLPWREDLGHIAVGGPADLSVYDYEKAARPWTNPAMDPIQTLVQRGSNDHVHAIVVNGRLVWQMGRGTLLVQEDEVEEEIRQHLAHRGNAEDDAKVPSSEIVKHVRRFFADWPVQ